MVLEDYKVILTDKASLTELCYLRFKKKNVR